MTLNIDSRLIPVLYPAVPRLEKELLEWARRLTQALTEDRRNRDERPLLISMTTAERDNIPNPAEATLIYDSTQKKLSFYNGTSWETVTSS